MLHALQDALRAAPDDEAALERGLSEGLAAYDAYLALVVTAHPMSCRVGCTACCHDNPRGVTGVEIERLRRSVDTFPDRARVKSAFARLAAQRADAEAWRRRQEPCPLLDGDGRCRAYAARPLACRAFVAVTPAEWCDPSSPRYADRVNPHLDPPRVILQILQALSARRGLSVATDLHTGMAG
ncbi:MAG: YkgJ family cysteine cluster protein [Pseudomonadota bacterium]|nr:YkgJ family cysteine cluster protein [Pseudomonadota bacterium]